MAGRLSDLSRVLWHTYTHPASAAESLEENTEGWRREGEREAFSEVVEGILKPNMPFEDGGIIVSYVLVEEAAHRLGRALHALGDKSFASTVIDEARQEMAAIEQAELGDLGGRARQAVTLTREDASPVQVAAADRILEENPLNGDRLFTEVDPTAAAVAAAHWLYAAAEVASAVSGIAATGVLVEADNIEALPHETPTAVLEQLAAGQAPHKVVTKMVRDAMRVAEGGIPDIRAMVERMTELEDLARQYDGDGSALREKLLAEMRITPLDPARPAMDLLEDLLEGIRACWLLYQEYDDEDSDGWDEDSEESEEEYGARRTEEITESFLTDVRMEAEAYAERLV